jgi:pimeloyl-ACP methyl ester carboxylesterase
MQQVGDVDQAAHWKHIDRPVLIIYGTSDFISSEADSRYLVDMINNFHPRQATLHVIRGMDHGLEEAPPLREAIREDREPSGRAHPELLPLVSAWLDSVRVSVRSRSHSESSP